MIKRNVRRLKLSNDLTSRLLKQNLQTCQDVLNKNKYELICSLDISIFKADEIILKASKACIPHTQSGLDLWTSTHFLKTCSIGLDNVLHGGIPFRTVTEIAGPSGCGKTQFCTMFSLLAAHNLQAGVIYIDTEAAFSAERFVEMAVNRFPDCYHDEARILALTERVHIYVESTCDALLKRIENIEEEIIGNRAKLVIIDSIASLIRKEFDTRSGRNMAERTSLLVKQAALLKHAAAKFNIPVIVTNQITTRYGSTSTNAESEVGGAEESSSYVTAALGNTWSHCVNTRLLVQYLEGATRQLMVAKSPVAPFTTFRYQINASGIVLEERGADHYDGTDPNLQAIRVRSSLQQDAFF